ncbi:MAG: helix-turn-helix domain-containing protein [Spirochaetota bacterium]
MNDSSPYIKLMSDIIDTGLWAKLSPAARTLYPVLLKFSDKSFKPVWPGTGTLLQLTGFKSKKSITAAKKDLINAGLLHTKPGTGRTNTTYYFSFHYKHPQRGILGTHREVNRESAEGFVKVVQEGRAAAPELDPINNYQKTSIDYEAIMNDYGIDIFNHCLAKAREKAMESNLIYIRKLCADYSINNKETVKKKNTSQKWFSFLRWASGTITEASLQQLQDAYVKEEEGIIFIHEPSTTVLKEIILRYFAEIGQKEETVFFLAQDAKNRIFSD